MWSPCPSASGSCRSGSRGQIGSPQTYYETSTYFGPDRRNRLESDQNDPRRGTGGHFRRIEIIRTPDKGIDVLSDELQVVL